MTKQTKNEYIADLSYQLRNLPKDEFEDAIHYVEEYFDEAGADHVEQVLEELGPVHKLAATIRAESTIKNTANATSRHTSTTERAKEEFIPRSRGNNFRNLWIIILGIFALPIALPILLTIAILIFTFFIVIGSLLFAAICCVIALLIISIPSLFSSIALLGVNFPSGLVALGISLTSLGLGMLLLLAVAFIISKFIPWTIRCISNLFQRFNRKQTYTKQGQEG